MSNHSDSAAVIIAATQDDSSIRQGSPRMNTAVTTATGLSPREVLPYLKVLLDMRRELMDRIKEKTRLLESIVAQQQDQHSDEVHINTRRLEDEIKNLIDQETRHAASFQQIVEANCIRQYLGLM